MKRSPFMLAALLSILAAACSSESSISAITDLIGNACTDAKDCPDLVCAHGICMEATDPCADKTCPDGALCRNGECQDPTELCGDSKCTDKQVCQNDKCIDLCGTKVCKSNEICDAKKCKTPCGGKACADDEICQNKKCVKQGDCGGIACKEDETCVNDACVPKGDCGGVSCKSGEVCFKDACRPEGDCGGVECQSGEVCFEDYCYPKGDCGGIECQNGLVCDIYNDVCRNPGDCGGIECGENEYCLSDICTQREQCGDIYCEPGYECKDDSCVPGAYCLDGAPRCGEDCCTESQFCGSKKHCCEKAESCGSDCCGEGEVCESEICHIKCGENISRCKQTDGTEICCAEGEICISNRCYAPKLSCVDDYICENDEYCESTEKICLPRPTTPACEAKPTGGKVEPTLNWHWGVKENDINLIPEFMPNYVKVMSAPMVADIDGDGNTEVVFNSWYGAYVGGGILRIIDGKTGVTKYSSNANPMTDGGGQTAIGDIRKDIPGLEIVTCVCTVPNCQSSSGLKIALYNNKAEQIWMSNGPGYNECGQSGPGIADFDGDGNPEIYSRYTIYNGQTGEIIAHVPCGDTAYWHQACDYPTHADFDGDELPELVGGNVVYKVDVQNKKLTELWKRSDQPDGYPAVADLDLNGTPEIVVVRSGSNNIMAYNAADGTNFWPAPVAHTSNSGGPPTIANIDSTPNPEITFAGMYSYITFDYTGKEKWQRRTHDFSSAKTGSSVFDFDGDGKAEIVYADECFLRVYDGEKGTTRFCAYNTNGTHWEYPVIADIDNDNHAEILVSANPYGGCADVVNDHGVDECTQPLIDAGVLNTQITGLRAFSSPNKDWVNTRKIYNQHAYSVTNVSDDGTIPIKMRNNWSINNLNNFRLNVQPGATYMPDLEIKSISAPRTCDELTPIYFEVINVGWAAAEPGITVHVFASNAQDGEYIEVGTATTTKLLRASESETLKFDYPKNSVNAPTNLNYIRLKFDDAMPNDCNAGNNASSYVLDCTVVN